MKLNSVGLIVLMLGVVIVLYALLFMEVSIGGDVVNIHLLNQRLILVIIGSFAVLLGAGVLLATKLSGRNEVTIGDDSVEAAQRSAGKAVDAIKIYGVGRATKQISILLGIVGVGLIFMYLFGDIENASTAQGLVGLLFVIAAIVLNRDALRPKATEAVRDKTRLKPHLIASMLMILSGLSVLMGPSLLFIYGVITDVPGTGFAGFGSFLFLLGVIYLIGAPVWVWWCNRGLGK